MMPVAVRKLCQVSGFLLLMSMLFLGLSVGSYSSDDPSWNYYTSHGSGVVQNLGGAVGAAVAEGGLQAFGSTVFLLMSMGVLGACCLLRARLKAAVAVAWRGAVLLAAVSAAAHVTLHRDPFFGTVMFAGGNSGKWLAEELLVRYLNHYGTYLVMGTAVVLALCIGVEYRPLFGKVQRGLSALRRWGRSWAQRLRRWYEGLRWLVQWPQRACRRVVGVVRKLRRWSLSRRAHTSLSVRGEPVEVASAVSALPVEVEDEDDTEILPPPPQIHFETVQKPEPRQAKRLPLPSIPPREKPVRRQRVAEVLPSLDLLDTPASPQRGQSPEALATQARFLEQKLREFGVEGEVVQVLPGPVITMYEFAPAAGVKVNKIANLQDDLALVMRALSVRVVAPIPGKAVVGIEIPNKRRETVGVRDLLDTTEFRTSASKLSMALGTDILGKPVITDLALIPHLLIAGATGSGKSVGLNSMICSLLFHATPADVKLIMIDPKMLEFSIYDGIPHLLIPVVTDAKKAAVALRRVVEEMERRYQLLAARGVRSIAQYNQAIEDERRQTDHSSEAAHPEELPLPAEKLPYLVVVIDELSDLMMVSSREVEDSLMRIAQMARAAGIHLIVATQRPSVDVLTGVIKANFPARLSFQVTSKTDSRTILDANGAEKLLGRGDMLFLAPGTSKPQRLHGAYVSEAEINRLVAAWKAMEQPHYDDHFLAPVEADVDVDDGEYDEKYDEAVALVTKTGQASISMLQRRLRVGYNRAARMIEVMEKEGVVGPADGVKPREVLVRNTFDEL
jgi:S-DNA-T family DNA segregation ATPase FtsK/SpoIIIE